MRTMPHPDAEQLLAYPLGKLPLSALEEMERHLDSCTDCRSEVDRVDDSTDSFIASLARAAAPGHDSATADFDRRYPPDGDALRELLRQGVKFPPSLALRSNHDTRSPGDLPSLSDQAGTPAELPRQIGRYRILKLLGRGGMGVVYLAEDTRLQRSVAVKVPTSLDRFQREACAGARLKHVNICAVYDSDQIGDTHFLVLEYVEGGTLADLLKLKGRFPSRQAALLLRQLAGAMRVAHEKKVVHRDLKPGNVLLRETGEPVIADFSLCQLDEAFSTVDGTVMGTPAYMAPEQAAGKTQEIGPRTDIYALGVICYELSTGRVPFRGSQDAVLRAIIHDEPKRPTELNPDMDPRLEAICLKAMAKDPANRYASMEELAAELDGYLSPAGVPAPPPRWPRWAGWVAAGFLGLLVTLAVVLLVRTEYGTVRIEINDPKAKVLIDGNEFTITELGEPIKLTAGKHGLTVKRGDMVVKTHDFKIQRGKNEPIRVTLPPEPPPSEPDPPVRYGMIRIEINDPTAKVVIDGRDFTITELSKPMKLTVGKHGLTVRYADGVVETREFNVEQGENKPLIVTRPIGVGSRVMVKAGATATGGYLDPKSLDLLVNAKAGWMGTVTQTRDNKNYVLVRFDDYLLADVWFRLDSLEAK